MSASNPFLGYNFTSPIDGHFIPQRLQNLCIRDYAQGNNLNLTFSVAEYFDHERGLMLFAQLDHLNRIGGLIFFSMMMLPRAPSRRRELFRKFEESGKQLHFALENWVMDGASKGSAVEVERMFRISADPRPGRTRQLLLKPAP